MRSILAVLPSMTLGLSPAPAPTSAARPAFSAQALAQPAFAPAGLPATARAEAAPSPALALPALQAAAAPIALEPSVPVEGARAAAAVSFGETASPLAFDPPAVEAESQNSPRYRLAPLGFEGLASAEPDSTRAPAAPRAPETKPLLLRHYSFVRFLVAPIVRLLYSVRAEGLENVPDGPALFVPNHVSFMDPILVAFAANRPMHFLMYRHLYEALGLQWLFHSLGAIPISSKDPKDVIAESLYRTRRALVSGDNVTVFPEGRLTRDGHFSPFRRGFERVAAGTGAPVIPVYIDGMWGSAFSRHPNASLLRGVLERLRGRRRVSVRFGPALPRADATLAREAISLLAAQPDARPY